MADMLVMRAAMRVQQLSEEVERDLTPLNLKRYLDAIGEYMVLAMETIEERVRALETGAAPAARPAGRMKLRSVPLPRGKRSGSGGPRKKR
ncbi:MAG: hypothetical protein AAB262_11465 [Elusimicrobiota bacterium]